MMVQGGHAMLIAREPSVLTSNKNSARDEKKVFQLGGPNKQSNGDLQMLAGATLTLKSGGVTGEMTRQPSPGLQAGGGQSLTSADMRLEIEDARKGL